ncbi:MAG: beta-lactamase family protein [Acidimicrobiales bacterium]|nr:beta-lactamase family protein [Acidimicrobiales bacterium]
MTAILPPRLDPARVEALLTRAHREVDQGLLPSCQLALAVDGEVVVHEAIGDATLDTRYVVFSCTKALVAGAMWVLIGEGLVDPASRVVEHVPEFGTNGKEVVTVEHVMLHTSGFPYAPLGPPAWSTREGRLAAFGRWRLDWEPGTRYEYHATSAHWVLAEIIERVTGRDYRDVVEERVTRPAGLTRRVLGVPEDQQDGVATLVAVGEPATPDELEAAFGVRELPATEVTPDAMLAFNAPEVRAVGVPGGGAVMGAADLATYYQALLHDPGGIWRPDVLADVTSHVRCNLPDPWSGVPAMRTLGLVLAGDDGRASLRHNFGKTVSPGAFGHAGAAGQIAWADPATGLSFGYCTNGIDQHQVREPRRGTALSSLAAVCAGPR